MNLEESWVDGQERSEADSSGISDVGFRSELVARSWHLGW